MGVTGSTLVDYVISGYCLPLYGLLPQKVVSYRVFASAQNHRPGWGAYYVFHPDSAYLSIPIFLVIVLLPIETTCVLFGDIYAEDTIPLIILSLGQLFNVATGSVGFLLIMTGRQNHWLLLSIMMVALSGVLSILLIPAFGLIGASLATMVDAFEITEWSFACVDAMGRRAGGRCSSCTRICTKTL